ncbi:hypothetical protein N7495_001080 [Penicillium taxi]|uniref:uncharacterized protein n=1 Tax=Penicillium taxi TaxID=168475 RepID=UPI002544EAE1|nr:uncharacterized protein N7495_001080 [Penicillium taxi]KAJ5908398.1 hypothetical protein N7495_001080 [Penicillium taxi]
MVAYGLSYIGQDIYGHEAQKYIPQIGLDVHATVLSFNSRTVITQKFLNPLSTPITELSYVFPLYDSSSIVGFTCSVGNTVLQGRVKSKDDANKTYQQAVDQGKIAAILDQANYASDVFKTRVGNVPAGGTVDVKITLVSELKQDIQTNGPRYTVPCSIAPRYGGNQDIHTSSTNVVLKKTSIKVDFILEKSVVIRSIQSPSHPIQVDVGRTSTMSESTFQPCFASAKLRENLAIDSDFVLTVKSSTADTPVALLETHPTIPNQQALMVSLMPKFNLPPHAPEIVFVIDQSGSMYDKIPTLKSALEIFLRSLPEGVYFNLISFGYDHYTLWDRSRELNEASLNEALTYIQSVNSNLGGTDILTPLKAAVRKRDVTKDLELLLLTDGEVDNQREVFNFLDQAVKRNNTRAFALGIGNCVSHSLIEGVARAGNGFSQTVLETEELDSKVVRMLKGALLPRIKDATLEIELQPLDTDFETLEPRKAPQKPISLFDSELKEPSPITSVKEPLPELTIPRVLQAPTQVPRLFPLVQTTVYVLLAPISGPLLEKIILRATSKHGPLELEIPIQHIGQGETIHQLAVKKATLELEEGRGWIMEAKDSKGKLIKKRYASQLDELAQQECQRLGIMFQVPGKFCSFVAADEADALRAIPIVTKAASAYPAVQYQVSQLRQLSARIGPSNSYIQQSQPFFGSAAKRMRGGDAQFMGTRLGESSQRSGPYLPTRSSISPGHSMFLNCANSSDEDLKESSGEEEVHFTRALIRLQRFAGSWKLDKDFFEALKLDEKSTCAKLETEFKQLYGESVALSDRFDIKCILATSLAGIFLESRAADSKNVWELVKAKADRWLESSLEKLGEKDREKVGKMMDSLVSFC